MFTFGGFASFASHFLKKILYLWYQKPEKVLKLKSMLRLIGFSTFFYYYAKDLMIGISYDSILMKMRFISSYILVVFICNLLMPIIQYKSMVMTEFFIVNFIFISYILTYPCIYNVLLHLVYEIAVLVSTHVSSHLTLLEGFESILH